MDYFADEKRHLGKRDGFIQENGLAEEFAQGFVFEENFFALIEENQGHVGADVFEEFGEQRPLFLDERMREKQGVGLKVSVVRKAQGRHHHAGEIVTLERKAQRGALHEVRGNNEGVHKSGARETKRRLTVKIWEMRM